MNFAEKFKSERKTMEETLDKAVWAIAYHPADTLVSFKYNGRMYQIVARELRVHERTVHYMEIMSKGTVIHTDMKLDSEDVETVKNKIFLAIFTNANKN